MRISREVARAVWPKAWNKTVSNEVGGTYYGSLKSLEGKLVKEGGGGDYQKGDKGAPQGVLESGRGT